MAKVCDTQKTWKQLASSTHLGKVKSLLCVDLPGSKQAEEMLWA